MSGMRESTSAGKWNSNSFSHPESFSLSLQHGDLFATLHAATNDEDLLPSQVEGERWVRIREGMVRISSHEEEDATVRVRVARYES